MGGGESRGSEPGPATRACTPGSDRRWGGGKYGKFCYKNELDFSLEPHHFIDEEGDGSQAGERPLVTKSQESTEELKSLNPHRQLPFTQCSDSRHSACPRSQCQEQRAEPAGLLCWGGRHTTRVSAMCHRLSFQSPSCLFPHLKPPIR